MRILLAPDKFKGSLSAAQVAAAIARGFTPALPDAQIISRPIADGGEGFMETLAVGLGGAWEHCLAVDARGREIESRYAVADTPQGRVAILEMAATAGIAQLAADEREPLTATTRGVGMQMRDAILRLRVDRMIIGLGGSATNDGGCGMAAALGVRFLDSGGMELDPIPANLRKVERIDRAAILPLPEIIAACDVDNTLLGMRGATAVFGPQKGATPEKQEILEAALRHMVEVGEAQETALVPGAGAAGGLGFGLLHFAGARLEPGFDIVARLENLESLISEVDWVVTGEGSLDRQSLHGKGPVGLARLAAAHGVPTMAFCGRADEEIHAAGVFSSIHALEETGQPLEILIREAAPLLVSLASRAAEGMKTCPRQPKPPVNQP